MKCVLIFIMGCLLFHPLVATQYKTFEENGKVGLKDDNNQVVLPAAFEALGWSDGNFSVIGKVTGYRQQGLWGLINLEKKFITPADYEKLEYAGGEWVIVRKKINSISFKTGCLNLKGEIKIPLIYDGIKVQGLRAIVFNLTRAGYQYGLVDFNQKIILPAVYQNISPLGTLRYAVENKVGKVALFSEEGKAVTGFVIDSVSAFRKGYAIVYQDHLQGLIGRDGQTKLETKYASIKIGKEGKIATQLPTEWTFVNDKNETKKKLLADELKITSGKNIFIKRGNRWGVVDENFKEIVPLCYEQIREIEPQLILARFNAKYGVINLQNTILVPFYYDSLWYQANVYSTFLKGRGWELLNAQGKIITDRFYEQLHLLNNNYYLAKNKGYFGFVDSKGNESVHCVFDSLAEPVGDLIAVKFKGGYGIINKNEDWIVPPQQFPITVINANLYLQKQPGNQFLKSLKGDIIYFTPYPLKFGKENFVETLPSGIEKTITYDGLISKRTSFPENTEIVFQESEGYRGIKKDGRFGFIDTVGHLRIANRYDSVGEFHEGLAAIKLISKWGFVNIEDRVVINPNYDSPANFTSGVAVVSRNNQVGLIEKNGKVILALRYDKIIRQTNTFKLISNKLQGLADETGRVQIEPRYDSLTVGGNEKLIACRDGKCGVISSRGMNIIPIDFDRIIFDDRENIFLLKKKSEWKEEVLH
ncbi:MAG: WG repeat-containing protein [Bacteroidetes bacterium]|nr:WG repeat-containing protein [Bacteroidota bacterium]